MSIILLTFADRIKYNIMANLDFLVIHCSATPEGREVTKDDIEEWHMSPKDQKDGSVRYKGKRYPSRDDLPDEKINGKYIYNLHGNGWDRYGYADLFHINGPLENLTPFNQDNKVDPWEMTWGAAGVNSRSRHICYAGGLREEVIDDHWEPADTRTPKQLYDMEVYVRYMLIRHPHIEVGGHNQFTKKKSCPSFDVPEWLRSINIDEKNIYNGN
jgi:N-acetylmuramoyl-L-alanine amidase